MLRMNRTHRLTAALRLRRRCFGLLALVLLSGCGGSDSNSKVPTTPTSPQATGGGNTAASAVVRGVVTSEGGGSSSSGAARPMDAAGVARVEIAGTNVSSPVDGQGHFTLTGVPAGPAQLTFAGPSVRVTTTVNVESGQQISVIVTVSPTGATVLSDSRNPEGGQLPVNGIVEALSGSAAAFQFTVNGLTILGDAQTAFYGDGSQSDSFIDLKTGMRVEVKATAREGGLYAFRLHLNKDSGSTSPGPNPSPNPGPGTPPGREDESASIEGVLTGLGGSAPTLQLVVAGVTVRTDASTEVQRRGDRQDLGALRVGQRLHVVGVRRADTSIDARLIQIKDDETSGAFEIEGALGGLKGACPSLTFKVNGFDIATNGSTTFSGGACAALKSGDKVTVNGIKQADGSVLASSVRRN